VHLAVLHLIAALAFLAAAPLPAFTLRAMLYLGAGVASGARDALNQLVLGDAAAAEHRTETFAWLATFMWAGFGVGATAAGQLNDHIGPPTVFVAAAT